jgi:hypothetical protein
MISGSNFHQMWNTFISKERCGICLEIVKSMSTYILIIITQHNNGKNIRDYLQNERRSVKSIWQLEKKGRLKTEL